MATSPGERFLAEALGPESTTAGRALERLASVFDETQSLPPIANCYHHWASHQPEGADSNLDAFLRHTFMSLVGRFVAYRCLERRPTPRDLSEVVNGDYFIGRGLGNFLSEDFFSWPFLRLSMGIGDDALSIETAKDIMAEVLSPDLVPPSLGAAAELRRRFLGQGPAIAASSEVAAGFAGAHGRTCISPYCGDGLQLGRAVQATVTGKLEGGLDPMDVLLEVTDQFLAMENDPLAASVASVEFILALSDVLSGPHPPIIVPIYMARAGGLPELQAGEAGTAALEIESAGGVCLPERVAADPVYLDWLMSRMPNYLRGTALRLRGQPQEEAVQEVLNAWYNYLTSPKARTPIPEPLSPAVADVMVEAARSLILQYVSGSGPGPLHIARNAPATLSASRRQFDAMLWPADLTGEDSLKQNCARLYLKPEGRVSVV